MASQELCGGGGGGGAKPTRVRRRLSGAAAELGDAGSESAPLPGLTRQRLKGRLQRCRLSMSHCEAGALCGGDGGEDQHQREKMLEAQRKLQEQIEVKRHLQLRMEAQGRYLQSVFLRAQSIIAAAAPPDTPSELDSCITSSADSETAVSKGSTKRRSSGSHDDEQSATSGKRINIDLNLTR